MPNQKPTYIPMLELSSFCVGAAFPFAAAPEPDTVHLLINDCFTGLVVQSGEAEADAEILQNGRINIGAWDSGNSVFACLLLREISPENTYDEIKACFDVSINPAAFSSHSLHTWQNNQSDTVMVLIVDFNTQTITGIRVFTAKGFKEYLLAAIHAYLRLNRTVEQQHEYCVADMVTYAEHEIVANCYSSGYWHDSHPSRNF